MHQGLGWNFVWSAMRSSSVLMQVSSVLDFCWYRNPTYSIVLPGKCKCPRVSACRFHGMALRRCRHLFNYRMVPRQRHSWRIWSEVANLVRIQPQVLEVSFLL